MKKVLLTALVAMFAVIGTAQAQFSAGTISVGGGVGISTQKTSMEFDNNSDDSNPTINLMFSPQLGYFLADDLEVGARIGLNRSALKGEMFGEDYKSVTSMVSFGPYARKYFSLGETLAFFGEAGFQVGGGKSKFVNDDVTIKSNRISSFNIGLSPGIVFRPADRVGIELMAGFFGYQRQRIEDPADEDADAITNSSFGLSVDMSNVALGIKLYF